MLTAGETVFLIVGAFIMGVWFTIDIVVGGELNDEADYTE